MVKHPVDSQAFHLYACLPFVELAHERTIRLGPVIFWSASQSEKYLPDHLHASFQAYFQSISKVKVRSQKGKFIHTALLDPKGITCVSIAEGISNELREFILIDSLYLLYFACTFRNLYYGEEIPSFNVFRKMIPASFDFIQSKQNWKNSYIDETSREETICLHIVDVDICQGLGKALNAIYHQTTQDQHLVQVYKRLVRSIRYLVDRFFQRFINLFDKGLSFPEEIFEPEDVIFLASSFETLFDLNDQNPAADFKHKLRPLLHLKYSKPVEIFWKWVDDFYHVKRRIINGDPYLDPLFRLNPNFEISHIFLGIKLFVYAIYYHLFKFQLLPFAFVDSRTAPDFKWIHPEEVLLFFWTEPLLLRKLILFMKDINMNQGAIKEETLADIRLLTHLFSSLYQRYYLKQHSKGQGMVRFIPTLTAELAPLAHQLMGHIQEGQLKKGKEFLIEIVHPNFIQILEKRLNLFGN